MNIININQCNAYSRTRNAEEGTEDELTSKDVHLRICTAEVLQHFFNSS